jgi:hypothetical protein
VGGCELDSSSLGYRPVAMQRSMALDKSDVTGAIRKGQRSDCGESARIVTPCVHFITSSTASQLYNVQW